MFHYILMTSDLGCCIKCPTDKNINWTYVLINDVLFLSQPEVSNVSHFRSNLPLNENIALVSNLPM